MVAVCFIFASFSTFCVIVFGKVDDANKLIPDPNKYPVINSYVNASSTSEINFEKLTNEVKNWYCNDNKGSITKILDYLI